MSRRLLAAVVPSGLLVALFALVYYAQRYPKSLEFLSTNGVWFFPLLVSVIYLAGLGAAVAIRAFRWLWPPALGLLVQTLAWFWILGNEDWPYWKSFIYSGGVALAAALVLFLIWLFNSVRQGMLERGLVDAAASGAADDRQLEQIRSNMMEALAILKRVGQGKNAIYQLPWFLIIGRPAAGKTVAIKNSGLHLPVRKNWVQGRGGTFTCDWFFTDELIFLDTPGRWVMEGADEEGRKYWERLLQLLLKFRGRRPLDGLTVVVTADDLLGLSFEELEEQASRIREVVDLIHDQLRFQFPVYVMVTKTDLVDGFVDFFEGLPPHRRHEILGWSNADPNRSDVGRLVARGFRRVQERLEAYRMEMVATAPSRSRAKRLFFFADEFREMEEPLRVFCEVLFADDAYRDTPVFRGFYFTSGTQGEGNPVARASARMAEAVGLPAPPASSADDAAQRRGYFLLDLFRELMVEDHGLVGRSALQWLKHRRDTVLYAFLPAVIVGLLVFWCALSFQAAWRASSHAVRLATNAGAVAAAVPSGEITPAGWKALVDASGSVQGGYDRLVLDVPLFDFPLLDRSRLSEPAWALLDTSVREAVLEPSMGAVTGSVAESSECELGVSLLRSLVALRLAERGREEDAIEGLKGPEAGAVSDAQLDVLDYYFSPHARPRPLPAAVKLELVSRIGYWRRQLEARDRTAWVAWLGHYHDELAAAGREFFDNLEATAPDSWRSDAFDAMLDDCRPFERSPDERYRCTAAARSCSTAYRSFLDEQVYDDSACRDAMEPLLADLDLLAAEDADQVSLTRAALADHPLVADDPCRLGFEAGVARPLQRYLRERQDWARTAHVQAGAIRAPLEKHSFVTQQVDDHLESKSVVKDFDEVATLLAAHAERCGSEDPTPRLEAIVKWSLRVWTHSGECGGEPIVIDEAPQPVGLPCPDIHHGTLRCAHRHPHVDSGVKYYHDHVHAHEYKGQKHAHGDRRRHQHAGQWHEHSVAPDDRDPGAPAHQHQFRRAATALPARPLPEPGASRPTREPEPLPPPPSPPRSDLEYVRVRPEPGLSERDLGRRLADLEEELRAIEAHPGPEELKKPEVSRIEVQARRTVAQYARDWDAYLRSITLAPAGGRSVAEWVRELSTTREFKDVLRPVQRAASAPITASIDRLDDAALRDLADDVSELDDALRDAQRVLGDLARDLSACEADGGRRLEYQNAHASGDPDNSLVILRDTLRHLPSSHSTMFDEIVRRSELFIQDRSDVREHLEQEWKTIWALGRIVARGFAGAGEGQADNLRKLLGRSGGLVRAFESQLDNLPDDFSVSPDVREWIAEAERLSEDIFQGDSDTFGDVQLTVSFHEARVGSDLEVEHVELNLGGRHTTLGPQGSVELSLNPFEQFVDTTSFLQVTLGGHKKARKEFCGEPKHQAECLGPHQLAEVYGPWSPLKLVQEGLLGGDLTRGSSQRFKFETTVEGKKPKLQADVTLSGEVRARGLGTWLNLAEGRALADPPGDLGLR